MIRFDREAPGGGLDVYVKLRNGKAEITFTVYLTEDGAEDQMVNKAQPGIFSEKSSQQTPETRQTLERSPVIDIEMYDEKDQEAARMRLKAAGGTEATVDSDWSLSTRTLLIYPHLWRGSDNPCLYRIKASITENQQIVDTLQITCPICSMSRIPEKGFYLNEKPLLLHAVRYQVEQTWPEYLDTDLELLQELGANCICPDHFPEDRTFYTKCLEKGIIVWKTPEGPDNLPLFCGNEHALLSPDRTKRHDRFYLYQACWSNRNVLHSCTPHLAQDYTNTSLTIYSNQKRVALYVDGILHEFKDSPPIFQFEDIPVRKAPTVITAQAGDHYLSLTI